MKKAIFERGHFILSVLGSLCGDVLVFVVEKDNDAVLHKNCFCKHPMTNSVEKLINELNESILSGKRVCNICNSAIKNLNDYEFLGCLCSDSKNPLSRFNFRQYHLTCFNSSNEEDEIISIVNDMESKRQWKSKCVFLEKDLRIL